MADGNFNDQVKNWFDTHGFLSVKQQIEQIKNPKDRVAAYLALAAFGQSKIATREPELKKTRDITIILQEDKSNE